MCVLNALSFVKTDATELQGAGLTGYQAAVYNDYTVNGLPGRLYRPMFPLQPHDVDAPTAAMARSRNVNNLVHPTISRHLIRHLLQNYRGRDLLDIRQQYTTTTQ